MVTILSECLQNLFRCGTMGSERENQHKKILQIKRLTPLLRRGAQSFWGTLRAKHKSEQRAAVGVSRQPLFCPRGHFPRPAPPSSRTFFSLKNARVFGIIKGQSEAACAIGRAAGCTALCACVSLSDKTASAALPGVAPLRRKSVRMETLSQRKAHALRGYRGAL